MGYVRDELVRVTTHSSILRYPQFEQQFEQLKRDARDRLGDVFIGPAATKINGYNSFVMLPDGSKEGWELSDIADGFRLRFVKITKFLEYADIVWTISGDLQPAAFRMFAHEGEFYKYDPQEESIGTDPSEHIEQRLQRYNRGYGWA